MRQSSPYLLDTLVMPTMAASVPKASPHHFRAAISQSLGLDGLLALVSLSIGILLSSTVRSVEIAEGLNRSALIPPLGVVVLICGLPSLFFLFIDVLSAVSNPATLPFARSRAGLRKAYAQRVHLLLMAGYFASILVALCWSAVNMLLVSKLFISAVFALALYALGQSIPSKRLSFAVSGVLFLIVLLSIQVFMVTQVEANSNRSRQNDADELAVPDLPTADRDEVR